MPYRYTLTVAGVDRHSAVHTDPSSLARDVVARASGFGVFAVTEKDLARYIAQGIRIIDLQLRDPIVTVTVDRV
ncbi:hypothetical protein [Tsukamurella soli]